MKKTFLNFWVICSLVLFFTGIFLLKVQAQTSNLMRLGNDKNFYLIGEKACFGLLNLPQDVEINSPTEFKFYSSGPNNKCANGCSMTLRANLFGIASFCTDAFTADDVGSWSVYMEHKGVKSNTINYTVKNQVLITNPTNSSSTQGPQRKIVFTANGSKDLTVYVNNRIHYNFETDPGGLYRIDSWYTADQPDSCPGGISKANEIKPWVLSSSNPPTFPIIAQVQPCQEGRTYTITVSVNYGSASSSIIVRVKKSDEKLSSFCSNIEENKTYTFEELQDIFSPILQEEYKSCELQYSSDGNHKTNYYSPSGDPTGIPPGNLFKADFYVTSIFSRVKAGSTYLCSYFLGKLAPLFGANGSGAICLPGNDRGFNIDFCVQDNDVRQKARETIQYIKSTCGKSINISITEWGYEYVVTAPQTSTSEFQSSSTSNISPKISNPLDVSFYSPTTIPGVTDKTTTTTTNQTSTQPQNQGTPSNISVINSLVDTLAKLTSILDSAKNLNAQTQQSIIQALQAVVDGIKNIISKL